MNQTNEKPHLSVVHTNGVGRPSNEEILRVAVPTAEWVSNPREWHQEKFIEEISNYLLETYSIVEPHQRHAIAMLAGHIDTYIKCTVALDNEGLVATYNDGKSLSVNQYVIVRSKVMPTIMALMNELGLTPKSKLSPKANANNNNLAKILKGPKG